MQPAFDFSNLVPDFTSLNTMVANGQYLPNDTATLSAFFVLALLLVFGIGLCLSSWAYFKASRRIGFYHKTLLGDVSFDNLHERLHDINNMARESEAHRHLWREFTETLVEINDGDTSHYHNTYDAEHFFNTTSLSRGASESRIAVAVPGFLTAIGVLGTFVGLQMGLSSLDLAQNASVDELRASIGHMISGAAVAFTTSVWGVFLSLLFNFFEKKCDWHVRTKLLKLQTRVDQLFPRITPEYQLVKIANDGSESREALQGLADKIGDKMQLALDGVTESIQTGLEQSLENIMKPAIDKLVDVGTDTSSSALDNMLGQFMESMGKEGNRQRDAMDQASQQMLGTLEQLGTTLSAFMNRLEQQETESAQRQNQLGSTMATQIEQMAQHSNQHVAKLAERSEATQQAMTEQMQTIAENIGDKQAELGSTLTAQFQQLTNHSNSHVTQLAERTESAQQAMNEQMQTVAENIGNKQAELGNTLTTQFQQLTEHSNSHVTQLTERTEAAHKAMSTQVQSVVSGLSDQQAKNQQQFNQSVQQLAQSSNDSSEQIRAATSKAAKDLTDSVSNMVGDLRTAQTQQHAELQEQNKNLRDSTEALLAQVNTLLRQQVEAVSSLLNQGRTLQSGIEQSANANVQAATKTLTASEHMQKVSQDINVFGSSMRDAANGLSGTITQAVDATRDLASQNQLSAEKIESLRDDITTQHLRLGETRSAIDNTLSTADQIFADMREHQDDYLEGLQGNVEELITRLNGLLREYAKEVQTQTGERMDHWNKQTSAYTTQMTSAIEALAGAVDEIETKVQGVA
ncbi:hypothetical protein SAMN04488540_11020 [Ferrimonas sediminum]|uniref:Uncharacterized protein n=1 Tax=Ferrimonas sediminum TaxID=718193 RepID=A0A1G8UWF5_9GAMM|nr:anti-phage ZorAB system protein ZorA [Ferrimonas sediminum]SDJ58131.1 hypothetical protein SAMN04488540_11020 [Ferrimonas sediminum]